MARLYVEGYTEQLNVDTIPDVNPVVLMDGPSDENVAFRSAGGFYQSLIHDTNAGLLFNYDTVDHDFEYFLRGTGVPGGEIDLTPLFDITFLIGTATAGSPIAIPFFVPLLEGQSYEIEMQEVVTANNPNFSLAYRDLLLSENDLTVSGRRITQILEVISAATVAIAGPSNGEFSTRQVQNGANANFGMLIWNQGPAPTEVFVRLVTPGGTYVIAHSAALAVGAIVPVPGVLNLTEGYSIEIEEIGGNSIVAMGSANDLI